MRNRVISVIFSTMLCGVIIFTTSNSQPQTNDLQERIAETSDDISAAERLVPIINKYMGTEDPDIHLVLAVIKIESNFNSEAKSDRGALGLMQLMPSTAMEEYETVFTAQSLTRLKRQLIYQPELNVALGTRYLRRLDNMYKSVNDLDKRRQLTLASYNAGFYRVKQAFGCLSDHCLSTKVNSRGDGYFKTVIKSLPMETRSYLVLAERSYQFFMTTLPSEKATDAQRPISNRNSV